jgi:hypothetical protein
MGGGVSYILYYTIDQSILFGTFVEFFCPPRGNKRTNLKIQKKKYVEFDSMFNHVCGTA